MVRVRVGNSVPQQMKILLIQLKRIGDLILTTPAVAAVREKFPDASLTIVISSEALDASLNSRNTRTYFSAESRTARALEIARLSLMLASLISRDVWPETRT